MIQGGVTPSFFASVRGANHPKIDPKIDHHGVNQACKQQGLLKPIIAISILLKKPTPKSHAAQRALQAIG